MKAKFLQKKLHPSNLAKDLLEKHGKHLLWKSHEPIPGTSNFIPHKLEPILNSEPLRNADKT